MARFCPVAPIQVLEGLHEKGLLGDSHLLLAHHVLEYPDRFKTLFDSIDQPCTIIMDNSLVELGDAANEAKVHEACKLVKGKDSQHWVVPVLTDVMADGPATITAAAASYDWWKVKVAGASGLMVVLQGNSWDTFVQTADHFLTDQVDQYPRISWVGIPRVLVEHLGTREKAIKYVQAIAPSMNIHLLGFSNNISDDIICASMYGVGLIDSAVPLRLSEILRPSAQVPPRPKDWFETAEVNDTMLRNLNNVRRWVA